MKLILTLNFLLSACLLSAQTDSVKYTRDFVFKEGIYVSYADFKNNKPNLTPENFKQYNPDTDPYYNFFEGGKGFFGPKKKKLFYPDSSGTREYAIDSLYGYVLKNHLYIIKSGIVLRVFKLGAISYCFPKVTGTYDWTPPNVPNDYPTPNVGPGAYQPSPRINKEEQYFLNLATKKIYDYDAEHFEKQLKKIDEDLYNEFSKLSRSKKKKMMFIYLNKVNEKHPIYFKN